LNPIAETEFNHLTITEIRENTIPQAERFGGVGAGVLTIWLKFYCSCLRSVVGRLSDVP